MKIVIMAGGKGSRMTAISSDVPKPMIKIEGKPILEHQIVCLRNQGFVDVILVIGHLGGIIEEYFGNGEAFGVHITYICEDFPLGTAGALYFLKQKMDEDFLLLNGDIIFDVDIYRFAKVHSENNGLVTILTHPNDHPYDSSIIVANADGEVQEWITKEDERIWYKNRVNAGLHMISPELLQKFEKLEKKDLDRDILKPLIESHKLYLYDSSEYVKDVGTPDRYNIVVQDIKSGLVEKRNLLRKQKAFFLDRDGTINKYVGFLNHIDDFSLLAGVSEAIKMINRSGYLAIVVTNQPVIARGEISWDELTEIHNKMETLLGNDGAYIDDIFCCPHHPDKGYVGECIEYKRECDCRKPKPGMLLSAAEKYNIDLQESWMVGDSMSDIEAGQKAGCKTAYLGEVQIDNISVYKNLLECVKDILNK